jgi:hypothetical protein
MGCCSLLIIYEPKSIGVFNKFQQIIRLTNFFIRSSAVLINSRTEYPRLFLNSEAAPEALQALVLSLASCRAAPAGFSRRWSAGCQHFSKWHYAPQRLYQ